jgi:hypothetical protein
LIELIILCGFFNPDSQYVFRSESLAVPDPVEVPSDVRSLLANDVDIQHVLRAEQITSNTIPKDWLIATLIPIRDTTAKLYLIIAKGPLAGAHGTTFWLIREMPRRGNTKILLVVTADQLEISLDSTSPYPHVIAIQLTGTSISRLSYVYANGEYKPAGISK